MTAEWAVPVEVYLQLHANARPLMPGLIQFTQVSSKWCGASFH